MKPQEKGIRPEKLAMEAEIIENFSDSVYLIVADYSGMDMPTTTAFKDSLRENGAKFSVVKNRMLARTMSAETHDLLTGQSAMIYGNGDIVEVAKVIKNFRKENSKPEIKDKLILGNAKELPFDDNFFDLVISINTLHCLENYDLEKSLKEMERVGKSKKYVFYS